MNGNKVNKDAFQGLLKKQGEGKTSAQEEQQINWIWEQIHHKTTDFDWDSVSEIEVKDRVYSNISSRISSSRISKHRSLGYYFLRVAGVLLLLASGALVLNSLVKKEEPHIAMLSKSTTKIQRAKIMLPDGSVVHLNVNSKLSFPEQFETDSRKVILEGEAYFDVSHDPDRPFFVESSQLSTRVLGTSFNVTSYVGEVSIVTVKSGKVQVSLSSNQNEVVVLAPNESAILSTGSQNLIKEKMDANQAIAWTLGKLEFEELPFDVIISQLEKYYHTPLQLVNYQGKGCLITASFENKGLNFILSNLKLLVDFTYRENEKGEILIDFNSCGT